MNGSLELGDNEPVPSGSKWTCYIMAVEATAGVLGNLFVCFVILRAKLLHNMTNYLLVNLAVADLFVCLQVFFNDLTAAGRQCEIYDITPAGPGARKLFCRLLASGFISWGAADASAFNLCVVTLERYVAIVHPLHYTSKLTAVRMKTLVAVIWIVSFLCAVPLLFTIEHSDDPDQACSGITYPHRMFPILLGIFSFLSMYLLPITLMGLAYYKMQVTLKRQAEALKLQHVRAAAYDLVIARQRLVSVLVIVCGALVILWTPNNVAYLLCLHPMETSQFLFCGSKSFQTFKTVTDFLFYLNSVINPIIYEFKYKRFRQGVKEAFCCCRKSHGANVVDIALVPSTH